MYPPFDFGLSLPYHSGVLVCIYVYAYWVIVIILHPCHYLVLQRMRRKNVRGIDVFTELIKRYINCSSKVNGDKCEYNNKEGLFLCVCVCGRKLTAVH